MTDAFANETNSLPFQLESPASTFKLMVEPKRFDPNPGSSLANGKNGSSPKSAPNTRAFESTIVSVVASQLALCSWPPCAQMYASTCCGLANDA